jgi:hypothetical protein
VPLPTDARTQLRRWLKQREQHPAARAGEPALWLGRRGRLSPRQLQRVVTKRPRLILSSAGFRALTAAATTPTAGDECSCWCAHCRHGSP